MLAVCVVVCTLSVWLSVQVPERGPRCSVPGTVLQEEVTNTYLPSDAHAVRSQRAGDDVRALRAERCLRVGRDQAVLRSVLGVHVVGFKAV